MCKDRGGNGGQERLELTKERNMPLQTENKKYRHAMHARVIFWGVDGLIETLKVISTFLEQERRVLTRKRTKMSN